MPKTGKNFLKQVFLFYSVITVRRPKIGAEEPERGYFYDGVVSATKSNDVLFREIYVGSNIEISWPYSTQGPRYLNSSVLLEGGNLTSYKVTTLHYQP